MPWRPLSSNLYSSRVRYASLSRGAAVEICAPIRGLYEKRRLLGVYAIVVLLLRSLLLLRYL